MVPASAHQACRIFGSFLKFSPSAGWLAKCKRSRQIFPRKFPRTSSRKIPPKNHPEELPPKIFPKIFPNFFSKQMHHFITIFFGKIFGNIFGNIFGDAFGAISGVADCSLFSLVPLTTLFFSLPVNTPSFYLFFGGIFFLTEL